MTTTECPGCGATFDVGGRQPGSRFRCARCQATVEVGGTAPPSADPIVFGRPARRSAESGSVHGPDHPETVGGRRTPRSGARRPDDPDMLREETGEPRRPVSGRRRRRTARDERNGGPSRKGTIAAYALGGFAGAWAYRALSRRKPSRQRGRGRRSIGLPEEPYPDDPRSAARERRYLRKQQQKRTVLIAGGIGATLVVGVVALWALGVFGGTPNAGKSPEKTAHAWAEAMRTENWEALVDLAPPSKLRKGEESYRKALRERAGMLARFAGLSEDEVRVMSFREYTVHLLRNGMSERARRKSRKLADFRVERVEKDGRVATVWFEAEDLDGRLELREEKGTWYLIRESF